MTFTKDLPKKFERKIYISTDKNKQINKYILQTLFLSLTLLFFSACSNKPSADKSPIEDVSDEVYEQIVQFYFLFQTQMDYLTGKITKENRPENLTQFIKNHELYEEAEKNAEKHQVHAMEAFPNMLMFDYIKNPDKFSETESKYIDKLLEFIKAVNIVDKDKYKVLHTELKEDLSIKEEFNPFTIDKDD